MIAEEWQQRAVAENAALLMRIGNLHEFIQSETFWALPVPDRDLLAHQLLAMELYQSILSCRISKFV